MNEADTRAELIDPKLIASGWSQVEDSYIRRVQLDVNGIMGIKKYDI